MEPRIDNRSVESCCRCFISRVASPLRKGRAIDLLGNKAKVNLADPKWVKSALGTTLLRAKPKNKLHEHVTANPKCSGGYLPLLTSKPSALSLAQCLLKKFRAIPKDTSSQKSFDAIWTEAEGQLAKMAKKARILWSFGRSQKFLNILIKYWFVVCRGASERMSTEDQKMVDKLEEFMHAPVDYRTVAFLVKHAHAKELKGLSWGWHMKEKQYVCIQRCIRGLAEAAGCSPIAFETCEVW